LWGIFKKITTDERTEKLNSSINALAFAGFIRGFSRFPLFLLLTLFFSQRELLSYFDIGLIFTGYGFLSIPVGVYGGILIDKMGRRRLMLITVFIILISFTSMLFLVFFNDSVIFIIISFYGTGLAISMQRILNGAITSDVSNEKQRIAAFGRQRMLANAGIGIGMIFAGIAYSYNILIFFTIPVLGAFVEFLVYLKYVPESANLGINRIRETTKMSKNRNLLKVSIVLAFSGLVSLMFLTPIFPIYFSDYDLLTPVEISILFALNTVIVVLFQVPVNKLAHKIGEIKVIFVGLLLYAISYLLFSVVTNFYMIGILVSILSIGEDMILPMASSIISKMSNIENRGRYFGTYSMVSGFVLPFGSLIGTSLLQLFQNFPIIIWITFMILGLVTSMAILSIKIEKKLTI
jgi:MFS family permease